MDSNLQPNPDAERTSGSLHRDCSAAASICLHCDYWTQRHADGALGLTGWCDLFVKTTTADHGRKCTGWTPREPLNVCMSHGGHK